MVGGTGPEDDAVDEHRRSGEDSAGVETRWSRHPAAGAGADDGTTGATSRVGRASGDSDGGERLAVAVVGGDRGVTWLASAESLRVERLDVDGGADAGAVDDGSNLDTGGDRANPGGGDDPADLDAGDDSDDPLVVGPEWDCVVADAAGVDPTDVCAAASSSPPVVAVVEVDTDVAPLLEAGVTECVRASDPAAERLLRERTRRVAEEHRARARRVRQREWFDTVLEYSTDSMSVVDEDAVALYNTPAVEDQLGYSPAELRGENVLEHVHPDDRAAVREQFEELVEQPDGSIAHATYRRRHADGSWRWIEAVGNVQFDNPAVGGLIVNRRDVTERERQRERLREQEAYVASVLDAQPDVFYVLDDAGNFVEWNARLPDVVGYDDGDLEGMHATELVPTDDHEEILTAMQRVYLNEESQTVESTLVTADGEEIPYQLNGAPLTDGDGEVTGLVGTGRDISDRVRREERLSVLNRILRHNLRNRTNVIVGHAAALVETLENPTATDHASEIRRVGMELDRLGVLARKVDRVLGESHEPVALDVEEAIRRAVSDLDASPAGEAETECEPTVDLTVAEPPDTAVTAVDALADAINELLDNAVRHSDAETPRVRIEFEVTHDPPERPVTAGDGGTKASESGDRPTAVVIHVDDDCEQIPPGEVEALGGAESRLEHAGGLGLWFVNWIVTVSGGDLSFAESPLGGNRVSVRLPTAD
ncbi:PAS domain S-box protein [Halobaculum sp. MBLA0147]|uniref:PAS domain S-box protein n=1 Tax=Halobaculum sp. MBLA0147 TaxID=3079934 RepID=UPI00352436FB